ncbi:MAG: AAA family ATPase [Leadbetterella sp.]
MLEGRQIEKQFLDEILQSPKAEFVAVYCRRRVGKTFLIRQYLKSHLVFDFTGSNLESNATQLANFNREFKRHCFDDESTIQNWSEAFTLLTKHLETLDKTQKVVVFIDELPWLDRQKSGFLGALQFFWNQHGSQMPHLVLIACGSAAS